MDEKDESQPDASYVIGSRDHADIVHLEKPSAIERVLTGTRTQAFTYVTSLLKSGVPKFVLAGPEVAITAMKIEALTVLGEQVADWIKNKAIAEDFSGRAPGYQTWVELLAEIDSNPVDADRLKAMKAMFLAANSVNSTDAQSIVAYQLFEIAKALTSGELMLMKTVYEAFMNSDFGGGGERVTLQGWAQKLAGRMGHGLDSLVITDSNALERHGLISPRLDISPAPYAVGQNWVSTGRARITELGIRFCENITSYEVQLAHSSGQPK